MSWLLSIRHNNCNPNASTASITDPYRIIGMDALKLIINELKDRGRAADDQSCSIPKPIAAIEYMRARIGEINEYTDISSKDTDPAIKAWIGTLAVIVLASRRNISIVEKDILVSSSDKNDDLSYLKKAISDDFDALGLLEKDGNSSKSYLKLFSVMSGTKKYPIAIADKSALIFSPINNVDKNVALSLGDFMTTVDKEETISGKKVTYTECVWKSISEWKNFSEDDKLYLSSWIDGMLKCVGNMKCKNALKALNSFLKASVDKYIHSVEEFSNSNDVTKESYDVIRWKSAWSYIALSNLYGNDLVLESVDTKISAPHVVSNWISNTFKSRTEPKDFDFMHIVVKHKGEPIIKLYPEVGLYLYEEINNPQVWRDSDGKWIDVFKTGPDVVCADFKSDLMWYLANIFDAFDSTSITAKALGIWMKSAEENVAATTNLNCLSQQSVFNPNIVSTPSVRTSLGLKTSNSNTYVDLFNTVLTLGLPGVFNPKLVVFYDDQSSIEESEAIPIEIKDEVSYIKAFWPITPLMAKSVVENNATLKFLTIDGCLDNNVDNDNLSLTVKFEYRVDTRSVLLSHEYKMSDICYLEGRVPYMTMWPYFLPDNNTYWENYYVGLVNVVNPDRSAFEQFERNHQNLVRMWQRITVPGMEFVKVDGVKVTPQSITDADNVDFSWQILEQKTFPRFIPLSGKLSEGARTLDIGCVSIVPPPTTTINSAGTASVGIDFGNSNTICAVANSSTKTISYTIIDEKDTIVLLNGADVDGAYDSLSRCWIPKNEFSHKFLSAVQLFNQTEINSTHNRGVLNGVILFDNVDAIINCYGNGNNNVVSALKAGLNSDNVNVAVKGAASVFLSQILLLCKLRARKLGCGKIYYHFSYPKSQSKAKKQLTENLKVLSEFISDSVGGRISLYDDVFINEAEAVKEYLLNLKDKPSGIDGYALVDIGGGTTDFSVWQGQPDAIPTCHIESSLRFAGISILTDSIISNFPQGTGEPLDLTLLRDTFGIENKTKPLEWLTRYVNYTIPTGIMEPDEKYLRLILDNIINKTGKVLPVLNPKSNALRCHVHLKYLAAFFAIAKSSASKGKLICPGTGSFNIYLAGGGSQCIDFASDDPGELNTLVAQMFKDYVFDGNTENLRVKLIPPNEGMCKLEVATGLLKHYMDTDASGKKEKPVVNAAKDSAAAVGSTTQAFTQDKLREMYEEFVAWCLKHHESDSYVYEEVEQKLSLKNDPSNLDKFRDDCVPLATEICNGDDDPYLFICKAVSIMLEG